MHGFDFCEESGFAAVEEFISVFSSLFRQLQGADLLHDGHADVLHFLRLRNHLHVNTGADVLHCGLVVRLSPPLDLLEGLGGLVEPIASQLWQSGLDRRGPGVLYPDLSQLGGP